MLELLEKEWEYKENKKKYTLKEHLYFSTSVITLKLYFKIVILNTKF